MKIGGAMHPSDWVSTSPVFYEGRRTGINKKFYNHSLEKDKTTTIGHDVWIGYNVLIKQGVNIGTGSIIGMGSVVTKDIPPFSIVGGTPAKIIKKRFNETLIEEILESEWWELSDDEIEKYSSLFNDPQSFMKKLRKSRK